MPSRGGVPIILPSCHLPMQVQFFTLRWRADSGKRTFRKWEDSMCASLGSRVIRIHCRDRREAFRIPHAK
jgi:hypothetical protein